MSASAHVDVAGLTHIYISTGGYSAVKAWGAFYDNTGAFISGFNGYNRSRAVPNNAKSVRFTVSDTYLDAFMVNAGTEPLSYEPYWK